VVVMMVRAPQAGAPTVSRWRPRASIESVCQAGEGEARRM
jgi:hypothetical protein